MSYKCLTRLFIVLFIKWLNKYLMDYLFQGLPRNGQIVFECERYGSDYSETEPRNPPVILVSWVFESIRL